MGIKIHGDTASAGTQCNKSEQNRLASPLLELENNIKNQMVHTQEKKGQLSKA